MPKTLQYGQHVLIKGPGLDEVLEPGYHVVIVDDFYADYYGDYIFLGYDVYAAVPQARRGDTVGLFEAAALLDRGPSIVVCGDGPSQCLHAIAAHMALHGTPAPEALKRAASILEPLYGGAPEGERAAAQAVEALHRIGRLLGEERFSAILGAADSYNYGWGRLHYGETLAWLAGIEGSDPALLAAALHFLIEGPGDPGRLLAVRLEALTREALQELLGEQRLEEILEILRRLANGEIKGPAAELALVESLEPGKGHILYPERVDDTLLLHCPVDEDNTPGHECIRVAGAASRLLEKTGAVAGIRGVRLIPARSARAHH